MTLSLIRDVFTATTTLGRILVDGKDFGFCCEDEDRGLAHTMTPADIARIKVAAETAIPTGSYTIKRTESARYGRLMPEVLAVPGFRGDRKSVV